MIRSGVRIAYDQEDFEIFYKSTKEGEPFLIVVIGSSKTSTIPGLSIAGATPELTLLTPGLDAEYLIAGKVISEKIIPVTPTGIPTPAVVSRAVVRKAKMSSIIVDSGSYLTPKIPHIRLPSKTIGGRIDECNGLPPEATINLFREAKLLGETLSSRRLVFFLGESIPGGTTLALGVLKALGYNADRKVSSSGPDNPHMLKLKIVEKGLEKCAMKYGSCSDPFIAASCLGDPVHITLAGLAIGILDNEGVVVLSGGTQMTAVLALIKALSNLDSYHNRILIATTRWLVEDPSSDIVGLVKNIDINIPVIYYDYNFSTFTHDGLRAYERGYVKEGVAIGGVGVAAYLYRGLSDEEIHNAVLEDYRALLGMKNND